MATAPAADPPASTTPENGKLAAPAATASSSSSASPLKTPLPEPLPSTVLPDRPVLTADQQTKYDWLLSRARAWTDIPASGSHAGPITDDERMWLTRECLLRYLRATKWHQNEAEKRLLDTLTWRREYGVDGLTAEHISPENETGKQIILGYDKTGRPCHYLNPGRQNTQPSPRQVQHLVFMVERVLDLMPSKQETLSLLINFKTSKTRSNTAPGIAQGREVLHILQTHYPERLGKALIINVPWVVWGFFKLITPFIDPLTREKLKFNEDMSQYVPKETMWTEFSTGELNFDYDHSVYWPALEALCKERRSKRKTRWEAGGKLIGELEDYLTGYLEKGLAGDAAAPMAEAPAVVAVDAPAAAPAPEPVVEAPAAAEPATTPAKEKEPEPAPPTATVAATTVDAVEEKVKELKVAA